MSATETPFKRDPRLDVYLPYKGKDVIVIIRRSRNEDYRVQGKLIDVIQPPGSETVLVLENQNGPQLVPLNTMRVGSFQLVAKEAKKK